MIAFMDVEFNSDSDYARERTDFSIIEVGLILKESLFSDKIIEKYHSYVNPMLNNGKIYESIKELTGIKQSDVDKAKSFPEVFADIVRLIYYMEITDIYTSSDTDIMVLQKNCKLYDAIPDKKKFLGIVKNIQAPIENSLGLEGVSLNALKIICNCDLPNNHNSIDEALLLSNVVKNSLDGKIDQEALNRYKLWLKQKNAYSKLKQVINNARQLKDGEKIINLALNGEKFPNFE